MELILKKYSLTLFLLTALLFVQAAPKRIITLNSALTETVFALGFGSSIVATDVTSESPVMAKKLPKVSKNRSVSSEGLIRFKPDIVLAIEGEVPRAVVQQLGTAGVKVVAIRQQYSIKGALNFIQDVADALGETDRGKELVGTTQKALQEVELSIKKQPFTKTPKVLFIYARGTGTMSVAGKGSSIDEIIKLAGAQNAIQEFADFKPYTTEALVSANPDIILMFDFGLSSLGGKETMLKLPGVRLTSAGKNKRIIQMNGPLLINFSNRLPDAIQELNSAIKAMYK
ncbi:heme/hemin ABC transporter substrate-binding protein [Sphingobacterium chuzhouense]|uniref:ABC transporter substrate-binding protein n=1 Tax=Sphingobacterium chuzhouense TaxID=1742264 RepID=A0ABR7XVC0_9SPHI|nr:ABC transporter substrate-binding protein [Sphingobacterium chuzhouense]MBD1423007.1 ABC transporter substrate-binding protein [Sphingobacterium chuzhouense]